MPLFDYSARDRWGKSVQGQQEAPAESAVLRVLQSRELIVTKISLALTAWGQDSKKIRKRRRQRVTQEDLLFFIQQTAELIEVGVPLIRSLDLIGEQIESQKLFHAVEEIKSDIRAGVTFHEAIGRYPRIFPTLWGFLIEAGETGGNLPLILKRLAQYVESSVALKKKIVSALVYPIFLIGASIVAVLIFMLKIVPVFIKLFAGFNAKLPPFTLAVIGVSNFIQHYIVLIIFAAAGAVYAFKWYGRTPLGRKAIDTMTLRMPLFGPFIKDAVIARLSLNLATLLKNGVNILQCLDIVSRTAGNAVFEGALINAIHDIRQGITLSQSLEKSGLFSSITVSMVLTGEESGRLSYMIEKMSEYYQGRVDTFVARLGELIAPIILLFVGGVIGTLVVAMFLPIFNLGSAIR